MTRVIFYDSLGCIGGNKIVVESEQGSGLLLDFGFNFEKANKFLESPFLTLREYRILFDAFKTDFLPLPKGILQGIYREDLYKFYKEEIETRYNINLSLPPKITHVLISHGHSDHIGHIKYLHQSIQPVCGKITHCVLKHYEKVYTDNSNFTGIMHYKDRYVTNEEGLRNFRGESHEREVYIADEYKFLQLPRNPDFLVAFYPTDHSLVGAGAFLIHDRISKKRIVYSGDLRLHGPNAERVHFFIQKAKEFQPDLLIIEGTRIAADIESELKGESQVEQEITEFLQTLSNQQPNAMVFFECSRTDLFRIQSFYQAATQSNRKLVIMPKTYHLLQKCLETGVEGLNRVDLSQIGVYLPRKNWGVYDPEDYSFHQAIKAIFPKKLKEGIDIIEGQKPSFKDYEVNLDQEYVVKAADITEHPEQYLVYLDLYSVTELCDLNPDDRMYFILSKSEWDDPQSQLNETKKMNWFKLFNFKEDHIFKAHCSGHIAPDALCNLINTIHPKQVIPIHTLYPEKFHELDLLPDIEIILAEKETPYEI